MNRTWYVVLRYRVASERTVTDRALRSARVLAGPNPYFINLFLQLRKVIGWAYVVCRRRPHPISGIDLKAPPWAGLLDIRTQRFSCPGCGGMAQAQLPLALSPVRLRSLLSCSP